MSILLFIKSLIVGFMAAAPVGPIGFLCISRVLEVGLYAGLITGLGAATADGIYGCIGALGFSLISQYLTHYDKIIHLVSGIILLLLGLNIFFKSLQTNQEVVKGRFRALWAFFSTFLLTLTNPMTIISFGAIFAALQMHSVTQSLENILTIVAGVAIGSMIWWCLLTAGIGLLSRRIQRTKTLRLVNHVVGILVIGLGIATSIAPMLT